ncbi:CU044_2847 family protein [Actinomadura napierensis]|uniref:CU044_2847 family protein n=1 Tax=Actinomadura napierensis TaxID=267854 RepID=A0ABP5K3H3_9ACTN
MAEVVRYQLDDGTQVEFETVPEAGFRPAGVSEVAGRVRDAVEPVVGAARVVLEQLKDAAPDEVEVKFGVKVTGKTNWMVAQAATDANFEIKLVWRPGAPAPVAPVEEAPAEEPPEGEAQDTGAS